MKEVTREEFKEMYFKLGGGEAAGWGTEYWNRNFEDGAKTADMKFCVEPPTTESHTRMMIVEDFGAREFRLFFMTEEGEESFFDFPDEG